MEAVDLAYAAGFIDGEGCVYVRVQKRASGRPAHVPCITVCNTVLAPLEFLRTLFGGKIFYQRRKKACWRNVWVWTLPGSKVGPALRLLRPYLRIKGAQADVLLELVERLNPNRGGPALSDDEVAARQEITERLVAMRAA